MSTYSHVPNSERQSLIETRNWLKYAHIWTAQKIALMLGINSYRDYWTRYLLDPHLPADPAKFYLETWDWWWAFLNKQLYETYLEALLAVRRLKWKPKSISEYETFRNLDPGLPSRPDILYKDKWWVDWNTFLWKKWWVSFLTYESAKKVVEVLWIRSSTEYFRRRWENSWLPGKPTESYSWKWWVDWGKFLNKEKVNHYTNIEDAATATQKIHIITSSSTYEKYHKINPRLPRFPRKTYKNKWIGWEKFLGKNYKPSITNNTQSTWFYKTARYFNSKEARLLQ